MSTQNKKTARRLSLLEQENAQLRSDLEATRLGLRREVDRIAQLRGEESWRDIATAPKDMVIDLWAKQRFTNCVWHADWREWAQRGYIVHSPTHWMPIPAPPDPHAGAQGTEAGDQALLKRSLERACDGCEGLQDEACCTKGSEVPLSEYCDPCLISSLLHHITELRSTAHRSDTGAAAPRLNAYGGNHAR